MKKLSAVILSAFALFSLANAVNPWNGTYTVFNGKYLIYTGELGEAAAPTPTDRKAAVMLYGSAAKDLFDSIGLDLKDTCGISSGVRLRQKGDLDCTMTRRIGHFRMFVTSELIYEMERACTVQFTRCASFLLTSS